MGFCEPNLCKANIFILYLNYFYGTCTDPF